MNVWLKMLAQFIGKIGRDVEHHAVDWFKLEGWVVQIDQFDQSVTGGMVHANARFQFFPKAFGGREAVIAITNGEEQSMFEVNIAIACAIFFGLEQSGDMVDCLVQRLWVFNQVPGDVSTALHQLKIISQRQV